MAAAASFMLGLLLNGLEARLSLEIVVESVMIITTVLERAQWGEKRPMLDGSGRGRVCSRGGKEKTVMMGK